MSEQKSKKWDLLRAIELNNVTHACGVRALLSGGGGGGRAVVNARIKGGVTPLMYALWRGRATVARILIEHKSDLDARTDDGDSVVMCASNEETMRLLVDEGVDLDNYRNRQVWPARARVHVCGVS